MRNLLLLTHRWVGLVAAAFLTVAGLTGALLAFYQELDAAINPNLLQVAPQTPGTPLIDPLELRERLARQHPKL